MQSREFTVGLWLPNWRSKVDDPFIESTCAHSTRRIQWLKYIRISTRSNRTRMSETFYWRGLFVAPIFRFLPCVRAHTRFSIFHPTWIVPFAPPEWHSHSSGIRHSISNFTLAIHAIPRCFSTESNTIFFSPCYPPHAQPFLIFRVSVGLHLVTSLQASSLPQISVQRANSHFAKRIQRTCVICFPVNSSREDRRCKREFTEDSRSHVFLLRERKRERDLVIESINDIFA